MRRKSPPRVVGPYEERGRWRIVVIENGERKSFFFPTQEEALKLRGEFIKEVVQPHSRKLSDVLTEWENARVRSGVCKPKTAIEQARRVRLFLEPFLEQDFDALTPRRAAALYLNYTEQLSNRTGKLLSAATHHLALTVAKDLYNWAIKRGYISLNPFKEVKAIGKTNAGKSQLRIDEARRFADSARQYFEEENKPLAVGALLALTMGLRTSEVLKRVVRDLDDGARYLWIDEGKTAKARRHLEVPALVQPYLRRLACGKRPDELLFGVGERTGKPHLRQSMHRTVRQLCERAGVPRVCTHSLRGLWATLAVGSGMASHAVAESLGHHSFSVTKKHYAQPSAVTNVSTARVAGMLDGHRAPVRPTAQDLLQQLDPDTLTQLAELLATRKGMGAPE